LTLPLRRLRHVCRRSSVRHDVIARPFFGIPPNQVLEVGAQVEL
jgi:hypothetical protein